MAKKATRMMKYTQSEPVLYLAFELSLSNWQIAFTTGLGQKPRIRRIPARDVEALAAEIAAAKKRFGVPLGTRVVSCYEAGRDAFWLHRALMARGIDNIIVDSSSIEVNRRARRAKADKLDVIALAAMLVRYHLGETKVWRAVRVPSPEDEDARHLHREREALKKERTRVTNRIKGLLITQGVRLDSQTELSAAILDTIRIWNGAPLTPGLKNRLRMECERLWLLKRQIRSLDAERRNLIRQHADDATVRKAEQLRKLRAIGTEGSWVLARELFGWRKFNNGREVGSYAGLTPTPYQSGDSSREQGISRAGNRYVRGVAVELAWGWLRFQPNSELSRWYVRRFANGGPRARKVGIVALARRLVVALWRFLETGALPEGAELKMA